ncbi:MAG TPA: C45 family peptidase [Acidimicrobiia bacterium]|nr:C45 family peptidase [Acidimicrobiia bacterium]
MYGGAMRVLEVFGDSTDLGRGHGSTCSEMIRKYVDDRIGLSGESHWSGGNADRDLILDIADGLLEHHQRFSESLYAEMLAMADASGITPQEAVAVGGFTDLVDVVRARLLTGAEEHNCTGIINPRTGTFAQTWDMHASAGEFVVLLKIDPMIGLDAFVQTTAGCLGQIGMNEAGIAVGINNLTATGKPGVTWPFVVRKALEQDNLDDAVNVVLDADLAGGHNYFVMGPHGEGAMIEAMPHSKRVMRSDGDPLVHANNCLYPETTAEEAQRLPDWVENSNIRLRIGEEHAHDLEAFFSDPMISRRAESPADIATCGAVIMTPATREMKAVWGIPGDNPWETFQL